MARRHPALERDDHAAVVDVALIAVEELVGALADLHDDRARRRAPARDEVLGHRRPVRQRLVLVVDELGHEVAHRLLVDEHLVVVRAELPRDHARVMQLVVARVPARARRVRPHRDVGQLGHQRDVGRGVEAARQEDAERDVGHHPLADRRAQHIAHRGDHLGLAHRRRPPPSSRPAASGPTMRRCTSPSRGARSSTRPAPSFEIPAEHRARRRREAERQVLKPSPPRRGHAGPRDARGSP